MYRSKFKPCRRVETFKVEGNTAYIIALDSILKLNPVASKFWQMSNGKNSINEIVNCISKLFVGAEIEIIYQDIVNTALDLSKKGILEMNWDPLYKHRVNERGKWEL